MTSSQTFYNNIPQEKNASSSDLTLSVFDQYFQNPIDINNNELVAMTGYFETRGFDNLSAETISITILKQAKKDGYNAMQIIDSLKGLDNVGISNLVAEIINYNRFKSSFIGSTSPKNISSAISRNLIDYTAPIGNAYPIPGTLYPAPTEPTTLPPFTEPAPAELIADFTMSITTGTTDWVVKFSDISAGNPTTWSWNFGDLTTSLIQSPAHTYLTSGTFTVTLSVTNQYSSTSTVKYLTLI